MTDSYRLQIGRRIRARREAAGYRNQAEFARQLEISPSDLSRIERGLRRLDTVLLRRIATTLEVSMDSFFPDEYRADERETMALARQGDANDSSMARMVSWALDLQADLDRVATYTGASAEE